MKDVEVAKKKDLIKCFGQLWKPIPTGVDGEEQIPEADLKGYLDPANVCMIIPKTKNMQVTISNNFDVTESKVPTLNYTSKLGMENICKYSTEYLKIVLEICKHYDSVKFYMLRDYPLKVETPDLIFVLAPRIDTD